MKFERLTVPDWPLPDLVAFNRKVHERIDPWWQRKWVRGLTWGGLGLFVASAGAWLIVLSKASLSFAYPFVSLTYALILLFDRFVLQESVSPLRWAGVVLIMAGIVLVSRTGNLAGA